MVHTNYFVQSCSIFSANSLLGLIRNLNIMFCILKVKFWNFKNLFEVFKFSIYVEWLHRHASESGCTSEVQDLADYAQRVAAVPRLLNLVVTFSPLRLRLSPKYSPSTSATLVNAISALYLYDSNNADLITNQQCCQIEQ